MMGGDEGEGAMGMGDLVEIWQWGLGRTGPGDEVSVNLGSSQHLLV